MESCPIMKDGNLTLGDREHVEESSPGCHQSWLLSFAVLLTVVPPYMNCSIL